MDVIKIYKYSLSLPLLIPLIFAPGLLFLPSMNETVAIIFLFIVYSGLIGGIPYLVLVTILLGLMRGKNELQIRNALMFSPPLLVGIFVSGFGLLHLLSIFANKTTIGESLSQFFVGSILCSIFILIFGYSYVLLVFGLVQILRPKSK